MGMGCALIAWRACAAISAGSSNVSALADVAMVVAAALVVAALSLLFPRYRSFRAFSWLFLIVCACALQLSRDPLLG
jgi:hypothetical protein